MITNSDDICKNCNQDIVQNFCSYCGQKRYKRIDRKYIWEEIQYTTIHTNKGFLYSIKNILRNPGKAARPFVEGSRVNHYKPIGLVFILSGISAFISFKILGLGEIVKKVYSDKQNLPPIMQEMMTDMMSFQASYSAFLMLGSIPILALCSKIVFRKWGHNYYEHVVMNAFGLSFYTATTIIFVYPIFFLVRGDVLLFNKISLYVSLGIPLMMIWFYKNFYKEKSLTGIIPRVLLKSTIFMILFFVVIFVAMIVYLILAGPEVLKQFQPK